MLHAMIVYVTHALHDVCWELGRMACVFRLGLPIDQPDPSQ